MKRTPRPRKNWVILFGILGILGILASLCVLGVVTMHGCATRLDQAQSAPLWAWPFEEIRSEREPPKGEAKLAPVVVVVTYHEGMPAEAVEGNLTRVIERWVNQTPGCQRIVSRSLAGVGIVQVYFRDGIDPHSALKLTAEFALDALPSLPSNTLPPVTLSFDPTTMPLGMLAISSPTVNEAMLKEIARTEVRNHLTIISGVVVPAVLGGKDLGLIVDLDSTKLEAHRLSALAVLEALRKDNWLSAVDSLWFRDHQLLIEGDPRRPLNPERFEEVNDLPLKVQMAEIVQFRDVGRAQEGELPQTARFRIDGCRAVGVPVYLQEGASPRAVSERVAKMLPSLGTQLPPEVQLHALRFGAARQRHRPEDDGLLTIYVRAPSTLSLDASEKHVAAFERFLEQNIPATEREEIVSELGVQSGLSTLFTANAGRQDTTIRVQLSRARSQSAAAYAAKLRHLLHHDASFADLGIRFASRDMPAPVDIRIQGGEPKDQQRMAQEICRLLAAIPGTVDVEVAQRLDAPYLVLRVDRPKAASIGLSSEDVCLQVVAALNARASFDRKVWKDLKTNDQYFLTVGYPEDAKVRLEDVLNSHVIGIERKQSVKLNNLVTLARTTGAVEIDHVQLSRVFDVRANIEERDRRDVITAIRDMLKELHVPEGLRVELAE